MSLHNIFPDIWKIPTSHIRWLELTNAILKSWKLTRLKMTCPHFLSGCQKFCWKIKVQRLYLTVLPSYLVSFNQVNFLAENCYYDCVKWELGTEAVVQRCSVKKVFLEISQNPQENTCARVSFLIKLQVFSCEFCEISKDTFFYRTPLVAASIGSRISRWIDT